MILPLCILELKDHDDRDIMSRVYDEYQRYMLKIAYRILHKGYDAEDVVQDCWISWCNPRDINRIKDLYHYRSTDKLRLFIASSVKYKSYNYYNREKKRLDPIDGYADEIIKEPGMKVPSAEETVEEKIRMQEIIKGIEELPPYQCEIMKMRYLEGFENKEIADMTGMNENSIRSIVSQARHKLKLNFAAEEDSHG